MNDMIHAVEAKKKHHVVRGTATGETPAQPDEEAVFVFDE